MGNDLNVSPCFRIWSRDADLHIATERVEKAEKAVAGETVESAIEQRGNLGLIDPEKLARGLLGQVSLLDHLQYAGSQFGFRQVLVRL